MDQSLRAEDFILPDWADTPPTHGTPPPIPSTRAFFPFDVDLPEHSDLTFIRGRKGGKQACYDGHVYIRVRRESSVTALVCLLEDKSTQSYLEVLQFLTQRCLLLNPVTVILDFETAEHNAFAATYPNAARRGCLFHFTQCHLRKFKLMDGFPDNEVLRSLLISVYGLPFLPIELVTLTQFYCLWHQVTSMLPPLCLSIVDWLGIPAVCHNGHHGPVYPTPKVM